MRRGRLGLRDACTDGWVAHGFSRGGHKPANHSCSPPLKRWATRHSCSPPLKRWATRKRRATHASVIRRITGNGALAVAVVLLMASVASAEVEFSISPGPYFVGAPINLAIQISNEPEHEPPVIPEIDGAEVRNVGTSQQTHIINFRTIQSVTHQYQIIPRRAGKLVIPPIEIVIAGETRQTNPKTLNVTKAESKDLLFVEVHGNRESIYLGESLDLTLEIWIKPFIDRRYNFGTTIDMQNCLDFRNSSWGPFGELLQNLRRLPVRRGRRADADGVEQDYYIYYLQRTVWPEKAGRLDLLDVNIIVQYPLRIDRGRTFFFSEARVTRERPISTQAEVDPITIKPVPTEGRPRWYNGAVGRYQFSVTAKPTEVHVGDPITLTMALRGGGRLALLQPPRLDEVEQLGAQFKIPDEMLAGEVRGNVKTFTQTVRARNDTVELIPAVPFTYFDTESEEFVTLYSDPIPIRVAASEGLAVSTIVESETGPRVSTRLTRQGEGILANYTDMDDLLAQQGFAPGTEAVAWIASPPAVFFLTMLVRRRRKRLKHDVAYATRRAAKRTALRTLQQAAIARERANDPREEAAVVLAAVTQYVANRYGLPSSSLTRGEALERLRRCGVAEQKIRSVDALLAECESLQYAGSSSEGGEALASRARHCIGELERERS